MSYARWIGSDVYVYMHVGGYLTCVCCPLVEHQKETSYNAENTESMVAHLTAHESNGDSVPTDIYQRLWEDDKENFPG